jgi:hypothetical protein
MAKMIKEAFLGLPWVVSKFKNDEDDGPSPRDRILSENWLLPMST